MTSITKMHGTMNI